MAETKYLMGMIMHFLTCSKTDGYFLCNTLVSPGAGAPPNRHAGDEESFYVLEGAMEFTVDGMVIEARPGDFVKVPKGGIHAFRNASSEAARMLILNVPGTIHETVFRNLALDLEPGSEAWPKAPPELDMGHIAKVCAEAGLEILAP